MSPLQEQVKAALERQRDKGAKWQLENFSDEGACGFKDGADSRTEIILKLLGALEVSHKAICYLHGQSEKYETVASKAIADFKKEMGIE